MLKDCHEERKFPVKKLLSKGAVKELQQRKTSVKTTAARKKKEAACKDCYEKERLLLMEEVLRRLLVQEKLFGMIAVFLWFCGILVVDLY